MKIRLPFVLALGATIFVVLLIAAYNFGLNQSPRTSTPAVVINNRQNPTAAPIPSDWKTFSSSEWGFSIKYPYAATFSQAQKPSFEISYIGPSQKKSGRTQTDILDGYKLNISVQYTSPSLTLRSDIDGYRQRIINTCPNPDVAVISEITSTTLSGRPALKFSVQNCGGSYDINFVENSGKTYLVTETYTSESYKRTLDQILSTLSFTSNESASSTQVPPQISAIFSQVGDNLTQPAKPQYVQKQYFYKNGKYNNQKVWQLNLDSYNTLPTTPTIESILIYSYGMSLNTQYTAEGGPKGEFSYIYFNDKVTCTYEKQKGITDLACDTL